MGVGGRTRHNAPGTADSASTLTAPPSKTALGQEELRLRTRKLSQRHRTVLLLVDGKRSLEAVLELAQKAGAAPSFFDELVALSLVEVHAAPELPSAIMPAPQRPREAGPHEDAVAPVAPVEPVEPVEPAQHAKPQPRAEPTAVLAESAPGDPLTTLDEPLDASDPVMHEPALHEPMAQAALPVPDVPSPFVAEATAPDPFRPRAAPPGPHETVDTDARDGGAAGEDGGAAGEDGDPDEQVLAEVRALLLGSVLVDGPVSGSLLALRVSRARTRSQLIGLVWVIQRSVARRPREAQRRVAKARELLGLGNTLVQEDTEPGVGSE